MFTLFRPESFAALDLPDEDSVELLVELDEKFSYHCSTDGAEIRRLSDGKTVFLDPSINDDNLALFPKARGVMTFVTSESDSKIYWKCAVRVFYLPANPVFSSGADRRDESICELRCEFQIKGMPAEALWVLDSETNKSVDQTLLINTHKNLVACRWPAGSEIRGQPSSIEYIDVGWDAFLDTNTSTRGLFTLKTFDGSLEVWRAFPSVERVGLWAFFGETVMSSAFLPDDGLIVVLRSGRVLRCSPDLKETHEICRLPKTDTYQFMNAGQAIFFVQGKRGSSNTPLRAMTAPVFKLASPTD